MGQMACLFSNGGRPREIGRAEKIIDRDVAERMNVALDQKREAQLRSEVANVRLT